MNFHRIGNKEILHEKKIAFLCSREIPAEAVLKCYDWAIAQRKAGNCVISGFHSQLERDVLHYLFKGKQSIILALARGLKKNWEAELKTGIAENRLLIITPFEESVTRPSANTAITRNRMMLELADEIVIGYAKPDGSISRILSDVSGKKITRLH